MKYWKINCLLKHETNSWWKKRVLHEINYFLWFREYNGASFNDDNTVRTPDNFKYKLNAEWDEGKNIVSVIIKNESGWNHRNGMTEPQIVRLTEDYFKLNLDHWYYIETLNEEEDLNINKFGRRVTPMQVKQSIDNWDKTPPPKNIEIIEIGAYQYAQTDLYKGSKSVFSSCLDFWSTCAYWIGNGEIKSADLRYCKIKDYFDVFWGSCIPVDNAELQEILPQIEQKDSALTKDGVLYSILMRKDWNDRIYIIEYEKYYVMHNWHTSE